jgi:threonine dehydratase
MEIAVLQNLKNRLFLKIETHETMNVFKIRAILNTIDSISAVYTVDAIK